MQQFEIGHANQVGRLAEAEAMIGWLLKYEVKHDAWHANARRYYEPAFNDTVGQMRDEVREELRCARGFVTGAADLTWRGETRS